ncbi:MAG TPA: glycosyltransferase family 9 protein [Candidatus Limnocylindria bacterium]|nr:glycosyltransferase family 9 protein [Candidatus Limnocylindria bacterium]
MAHWLRLQRILVIALSGIGDTLIATPLFHELRLQFPQATIDALVRWRGAREILLGNPHINAVHQHDFIAASKVDSLRFVGELRRFGYDLSINTHTQGRRGYRLIARLIGARTRLSHEYENQGWPDRLLVTHSLPQDYAVHCTENNVRLLGLIGLKPKLARPEYELYLSPEELAWAEQWVRTHEISGAQWLGIHAGSGGTKNLALRRWPAANYIGLVQRLVQSRPNLRVVFFGGPEERAVHQEIQAAIGDRFLTAQTPSLRHAAALVGLSHAFLSVDTLFMHLAAARKVPHQFVIETPTVNPPILPCRPDWTLIPNPAVHGHNLDYYRYDGRDIRGTEEELTQIMRAVTVETVESEIEKVFPILS